MSELTDHLSGTIYGLQRRSSALQSLYAINLVGGFLETGGDGWFCHSVGRLSGCI